MPPDRVSNRVSLSRTRAQRRIDAAPQIGPLEAVGLELVHRGRNRRAGQPVHRRQLFDVAATPSARKPPFNEVFEIQPMQRPGLVLGIGWQSASWPRQRNTCTSSPASRWSAMSSSSVSKCGVSGYSETNRTFTECAQILGQLALPEPGHSHQAAHQLLEVVVIDFAVGEHEWRIDDVPQVVPMPGLAPRSWAFWWREWRRCENPGWRPCSPSEPR